MSALRPNRSIPAAAVIPELAYTDVSRAITWLEDAFGFVTRLRIGDHRAQMIAGEGAIVVMDSSREPGGPATPSRHGVLVRIENLDAHAARATASGAEILSAPTTYPFGERQYSVRDPGGHRWTFSETVADIDPAAWGGILELRGDGMDRTTD
jgi:uncharacterized glyoxalase superfamily protein PhnB